MRGFERLGLLLTAALFAGLAQGGVDFDAGADLRIRQEIFGNVPGLPGGGLLSRSARGDTRNHMRYRTRVWGELRAVTEDDVVWRIHTRLTDEFRWNVNYRNRSNEFPDELILDNLFLETRGLFDGFLDLKIGRQDLYGFCGLDHVFMDGTPGDGSRSVYTDMARATLNFTEVSKLDVFFLYNRDDSALRWGSGESEHRMLSGIDPQSDKEMDDWGYGAIWSSRLGDAVDYQLFAMEKRTRAFTARGSRHPSTRRDLLGVKTVPHLTEELSLQFELMSEVGENGDGVALTGWSAYAGVNWKSVRKGIKPFFRSGLHYLSGDEDAADEDGGHSAWDPMWSRAVNDSEMFLYGTHYGVAWWSNLIFLKTAVGLDLGARHELAASVGPMFAAAEDGLGGGDGAYKGLLSQARYSFPIYLPEPGGRWEVFAHVLAELFNPGDYYETDKPAWFFRWQVEVKF